ncbi:MAG: N-acetylmuramoyl-L-alanine amidase [Actinobacteria bacterium]|nr:N-acetylmuramoyl-L-alanine amidase [Candidatus Dormibacteraeota bacterium]MBO0832080.1 N-acetylmuramoyl-L-alanine amidase [Actinomycetota bacterium]
MQIDTSHTSPAQTPGRQGVRVDRIVWHHTGGGSVAGALNFVTRPGSQVSYHYLVDEAGRIFRVVPEQNTSWHAGTWAMNLRSIGICHPVDGGGTATRLASVALTADICRRFAIPVDGNHILPHRAIVPTACPGSLPMAEWIADVAREGVTGPPQEDEEDEVSLQIIGTREDGAPNELLHLNRRTGQARWFAAFNSWSTPVPGSWLDILGWRGPDGTAHCLGIGTDGGQWHTQWVAGGPGWQGPWRQ